MQQMLSTAATSAAACHLGDLSFRRISIRLRICGPPKGLWDRVRIKIRLEIRRNETEPPPQHHRSRNDVYVRCRYVLLLLVSQSVEG